MVKGEENDEEVEQQHHPQGAKSEDPSVFPVCAPSTCKVRARNVFTYTELPLRSDFEYSGATRDSCFSSFREVQVVERGGTQELTLVR